MTDSPAAPFAPPAPDGRRAAQPLAGVRVADFTWIWAGPQCTRLLAECGAEVIKVESMRRVDTHRLNALPDGSRGTLNAPPIYNAVNRGKRSVRLNLETEAGAELAKRLIAISDIVVENFAPRVMRKFGLHWEAVSRINPALVMLSMSALGTEGPERDYILYGNAQVAMSGLGAISGYAEGPPANISSTYGDPIGAFHGAAAVLAAYYQRLRSGRGRHVEISQLEAMAATVPESVLEQTMNGREFPRQGNHDESYAPHNVYRCRDAPGATAEPGLGEDEWLAIAVTNDTQWEALCSVMGRPDLAADTRYTGSAGRKAHEDELDPIIAGWCLQQRALPLMERLLAAGVPASKSFTIADIARDPHLQARGFFHEIDNPELGRRRYMGEAARLSRSPAQIDRHAPLFGADSGYVLGDLLGLTRTEIERLETDGVVY